MNTSVYVCVFAQSCLTLYNFIGCSLPGSSVHVAFQAGILEWVAISNPGDIPDPGVKPGSLPSPLVGGFFITVPDLSLIQSI